ncbi:hypothetical protein NVP2275O_182 [Vibrio phage 2.275.O._10N.286.54.E11]|nr:hypothetical protein NVP2275O_182 [Vibrio phage 2.275.O._10N.286.54.E11]
MAKKKKVKVVVDLSADKSKPNTQNFVHKHSMEFNRAVTMVDRKAKAKKGQSRKEKHKKNGRGYGSGHF